MPLTLHEKQKLIRDHLEALSTKAEGYHTEHQRFLGYDTFCDVIVALFNFITVSAIFIGGIVDHDRSFIICSAILSTFAGVVLVLQRSINFRGKYQSFQISAKQYSDLRRDVTVRISRNNLKSDDYDNIISDIVERLAIIEDYTLPIHFHTPVAEPSLEINSVDFVRPQSIASDGKSSQQNSSRSGNPTSLPIQ